MISRDELLQTLLDQFKNHFGFQIDFDNPNLETWLVQTLSILDENQLMYLSLLMNESFLTTALLPSTIKKFALDYGYQYRPIQPAHGNINLYISLDQSTNIDAIIDFDTQFTTSNNITYIPQKKIYITYSKYTNVINLIGYDLTGNKTVEPYEIVTLDDGSSAITFQLPVIQAKRDIYSFVVSTEDVVNYKFPVYTIPKPSEGDIADIKVYVSGSPAKRVSYLFELEKNTYSFVLIDAGDSYEIIFGNSLIGKAPKPGDVITCEVLVSLGSKGNVYADTLQLATPIINTLTHSPLNVIIRHDDIMNGQDAEDPNSIRLNTIAKLHQNDRLVSTKDFDLLAKQNILPFNKIFTLFTESDLYVNEVTLFGFFTHNNQLPKCNTCTLKTDLDVIKQFTPVYQNDLTKNEISLDKTSENAIEYVLPFEIKINTDTMVPTAYYYSINKPISFKIIQEDYYSKDHQSYVKLSKANVTYNKNKQVSQLVLQYALNVAEFDNTENTFKVEVSLNQNGKYYNLTMSDSQYESDTKLLTVYFDLPDELTDELITGDVSFRYKFSSEDEYELLSYVELSPFRIKTNITPYVPLKLTGTYTIYGVPVIEYNESFFNYLNLLFINATEAIQEKKMITNKVALAFGKTYGLITNASLSTSPLNDIEDNIIPIPLKLKVYAKVHSLEDKTTIINNIIGIIRKAIQPGFQVDIIRSKLIQILHDSLDYLREVSIYILDKDGNELDKDVSIRVTAHDIPKNQILTFVPEVISVGEIDVDVSYV